MMHPPISQLIRQLWPNTDIGLPDLDHATIAGISVAIAGNILISLALNLQKLAHRRVKGERDQTRAASTGGHSKDSALSHHSPTRRSPPSPGETAATPTLGVLETDPLLSPSSRPLSYSSDNHTDGKWPRHSPPQPDLDPAAIIPNLGPVDIVPAPSMRSAVPNGNGREDVEDIGRSGFHAHEGDYLKSKLWWLGFLLMNVGETGNFISYAFAPASVVAPLGTFALIANCLFAPLMLGERFRKLDIVGILIAILGAITVVLSANPSDIRLDPSGLLKAMSQHSFIAYSTIYIFGAIVLSGLSEGSLGERWVYVDIGLCAIFGGFTVLSTKALSTLLTMEWLEIFTEWITYPVLAVLAGTGVGQIRYLNRALMRFDSKVVVPTQFVFFNLSAIVGSAILYGDFKRATFHQIVTFLYGCSATFLGVFIITWTQRAADGEDEQEDELENEGDRLEDVERTPRSLRMGSLARRHRATLVIPDGVVSAVASPILKRRRSLVSMIGLSPAQRLLLISSSPHDEVLRPDGEREVVASPDPLSRRRAISWVGDETTTRSALRQIHQRTTGGTRGGTHARYNHASHSP